ncbi:MAG: polysaccharide deacetylase family protein [Thermodesulfovibrionales bacterium]
MKRVLILIIILAILIFSIYSINLVYKTWRLSRLHYLSVLLVYNPALIKDYSYILKAYKSVLEEEGVPHDEINVNHLLSLKIDDIVLSKPVIIFPDGLTQILPEELRSWIKSYLLRGGNIAIIYDAGIRNIRGAFRDEAMFSDIVRINYINYNRLRENAYTLGYIRFDDRGDMDFLQIPFGKIEEGSLLGGYAYGKLEYPVARNELKGSISEDQIYAYVVAQEGERYPAVVIRDYGKGKVLYVNLPLGHLKAYSDDLPLRAILRAFLFRVVKIPHLQNTHNGKGGLVINWHIDSNIEWKSIPLMLRNGYLMEDIEYSIHITAGDFRDKPGDNLGFDACGKGKSFVQTMMGYGIIGSHGGWSHNYFSTHINNGKFSKRDIYRYIKKNNDCLESITGYKISEYAAPNGIHPQMVTKVLEKLGLISYYYAGDTGSAPNRTFLNKRMVSDRIVAFPIMPFGRSASLYEMKGAGKTEDEVKMWLIETVDYAIKNRTIRLIYSHPYDIPNYPSALKSFLDYAERMQKDNKIEIKSMSYFARFLLRFLKTDYTLKIKDKKLIVSLKNPEGLDGITVALPKNVYKKPDLDGLIIQEDDDYYYLSIKGKFNKKIIYLDHL